MRIRAVLSAYLLFGMPARLLADTGDRAGTAGVSSVWILANFCYAGMRSQANPSSFWRVVSFIFGFPGTLLSMLVVEEGSERVYGVDLPRSNRRHEPKPVPPTFEP